MKHNDKGLSAFAFDITRYISTWVIMHYGKDGFYIEDMGQIELEGTIGA